MKIPQGNFLPWFVKTIAEFGGEYVPFYDESPRKVHTSGRRESRIEPRYLVTN
jgi:hypothetical protein